MKAGYCAMCKCVFSLLIYSCLASVLYALPSHNPGAAFVRGSCEEEESCLVFSVGFYGDYVFDRKMKVHSRLAYTGAKIQTTRLTTNGGVVTCNVGQRLSVYGLAGATHLSFYTPNNTFSTNFPIGNPNYYTRSVTVDCSPNFCFGGGGTWNMKPVCGLVFGIGGHYFCTRPKLDYISIEVQELGRRNYLEPPPLIRYTEFQGSMGCSTCVPLYKGYTSCSPYLNIRASYAALQMHNTPFDEGVVHFYSRPDFVTWMVLRDLRMRRWFGYSVGTTFVVQDVFFTTVEGRWYDENAIHVLVRYVF